MYGMIHRGIEVFVKARAGEAAWDRVLARAALPDEPFVTMEAYPDSVTQTIVGATCTELDITPDTLLEEFGAYWMTFTANEGYGDLLKAAGNTLPEFLKNLDHLHTRVKLSFPDLDPPSFRVSDETASSLVLHYYSPRVGLGKLVIGVLRGLQDRFDVDMTVRMDRDEADERPHDRFHISWTPRTHGTSA